jgi:hypothetical protein
VELMDRGLSGGDTSALASTLAALEAEGVDTDGDGTPDVEGLALGFDPNTGVNLCGLVTAEYGCFHGYGAALLLLPLLSLRTRTGSRAPRRGRSRYNGVPAR